MGRCDGHGGGRGRRACAVDARGGRLGGSVCRFEDAAGGERECGGAAAGSGEHLPEAMGAAARSGGGRHPNRRRQLLGSPAARWRRRRRACQGRGRGDDPAGCGRVRPKGGWRWPNRGRAGGCQGCGGGRDPERRGRFSAQEACGWCCHRAGQGGGYRRGSGGASERRGRLSAQEACGWC